MTAVSTSKPLTSHAVLNGWVEEWRDVFQPDEVVLCDGSEAEHKNLCHLLVKSGTFEELNSEHRPDSYLALSDAGDTARVEDRTFIACENEIDAGPTNNWREPTSLKKDIMEFLKGAMKGRTMFVVPFCMGPLGSPSSRIGVQLTDSPYVVVNTHIMTNMGKPALEMLGENGDFVKCIHSIGSPLGEGQEDVAWPCDPDNKYIAHFPETREIWSYGSGYGGNALLGKKCLALRIASTMARDNSWQAEHMLIIGVTPPNGEKKYIAAAFPSSCGKTNMAMMIPSLPGWKIETVGDDIAWLSLKEDGSIYAINPEAGFFGVAPGTSRITNPNAMDTLTKNVIFTNVAKTDSGDVWWERMTPEAPAHLKDWQGKEWTPKSETPASHPNARFTAPAGQCPSIDSEWDNPEGVKISAILFGGRRAGLVPLVTEARNWEHGVFLGSIMSSETTAAATGKVGEVRFDPFAMLPFCGYNMGDYIAHWLDIGKKAGENAPKMYWVNWFRKDEGGDFIWPGFGENVRVLKWIIERLDGEAEAVESPIGMLPESVDISGAEEKISSPEGIQSLIRTNASEWKEEIARIEQHYKNLGERLPPEMLQQLESLKSQVDF